MVLIGRSIDYERVKRNIDEHKYTSMKNHIHVLKILVIKNANVPPVKAPRTNDVIVFFYFGS
jgi:hypothetical protein